MRHIPKYDRLRFRHEYEGVSIQALCQEHGYIINDFVSYAEEQGWEQVDLDNLDNPEQAHTDYTLARRKLTLAAIRRAMSLWHRVQDLEDGILDLAGTSLQQLQETLLQAASQPSLIPPNIGLEISRLAKVIESVQTNNKMFTEALDVAALNDADRKGLDDERDLLVRVVRRIVDPEGTNNGEGQTGEEVQGQQGDDVQDRPEEVDG